jgi:hypothetical protein
MMNIICNKHVVEAYFDLCHFLVVLAATTIEILQFLHKLRLQFAKGS